MDCRFAIGGLHRSVVRREQQERHVHQQERQRKGEKDLRHVAKREHTADQEVLQQHADHEQDRHGDQQAKRADRSPKLIARK